MVSVRDMEHIEEYKDMKSHLGPSELNGIVPPPLEHQYQSETLRFLLRNENKKNLHSPGKPTTNNL